MLEGLDELVAHWDLSHNFTQFLAISKPCSSQTSGVSYKTNHF